MLLLLLLHAHRASAAPAVLLVTVGQGVFRGLQNMRAPLLVTAGTNALHALLDVVLRGAVKVPVRQTWPLAQAAEAHRALEGRVTTGSIVLLP